MPWQITNQEFSRILYNGCSDLFAFESEPPDTGIRIMATRVKCGGDRCIQSDMELLSELSISSIHPDSSVPQKDTERSSRMHFHCTSLEKQTVVSIVSVNAVTPAFTVTSVPISSSAPRNEQDSHLLYAKFRLAA